MEWYFPPINGRKKKGFTGILPPYFIKVITYNPIHNYSWGPPCSNRHFCGWFEMLVSQVAFLSLSTRIRILLTWKSLEAETTECVVIKIWRYLKLANVLWLLMVVTVVSQHQLGDIWKRLNSTLAIVMYFFLNMMAFHGFPWPWSVLSKCNPKYCFDRTSWC